VQVHLRTRVVEAHGDSRLEALTLEDTGTGTPKREPAAAVFIMIGGEPRTEWLHNRVHLSDRGFILTDRDADRLAGGGGRALPQVDWGLTGLSRVARRSGCSAWRAVRRAR